MCSDGGGRRAGGGGRTWRSALGQWRRGAACARTRAVVRASHGGHRPARRWSLTDKNAIHRENSAPPHQAGMHQRQLTCGAAPGTLRATNSWRIMPATNCVVGAPLTSLTTKTPTIIPRFYVHDCTRLKPYFYFCRSRNFYCVAGLTSAIRISRPRQQSVASRPAQPRWGSGCWRLFWIISFWILVKTSCNFL